MVEVKVTLAIIVAIAVCHVRAEKPVYIGNLATYAHGVRGAVFGLDEKTIYIQDFEYDGYGPDAFFYVGLKDETASPSSSGKRIDYFPPGLEFVEGDEPPVLDRFQKENVTLRLPEGVHLHDLSWLSVWCRAYSVDFGSLTISGDLTESGHEASPEVGHDDHDMADTNDIEAAEPESETSEGDHHHHHHDHGHGHGEQLPSPIAPIDNNKLARNSRQFDGHSSQAENGASRSDKGLKLLIPATVITVLMSLF